MLHALCFCCLPCLESNCLQYNLQVVVGTELLFIYVVVVVVLQYCHSLYCVCRAQCVWCSIFCIFRWCIVLERLNENKAAAAVVVLYCCCDKDEKKRRQERKSSEKTEQMERMWCCCGLNNISVRNFLSPGCKEVMVHIVRTLLRTNIHLSRSLIWTVLVLSQLH